MVTDIRLDVSDDVPVICKIFGSRVLENEPDNLFKPYSETTDIVQFLKFIPVAVCFVILVALPIKFYKECQH